MRVPVARHQHPVVRVRCRNRQLPVRTVVVEELGSDAYLYGELDELTLREAAALRVICIHTQIMTRRVSKEPLVTNKRKNRPAAGLFEQDQTIVVVCRGGDCGSRRKHPEVDVLAGTAVIVAAVAYLVSGV